AAKAGGNVLRGEVRAEIDDAENAGFVRISPRHIVFGTPAGGVVALREGFQGPDVGKLRTTISARAKHPIGRRWADGRIADEVVVLAIIASAVVFVHARAQVGPQSGVFHFGQDVREPVWALANGANLSAAGNPEF